MLKENLIHMRGILILILFLIIFFTSIASEKGKNGYEKAMIFYEKYALDFIKSDLIKFNYHPRTQYDFQNDSNSYRVLVSDKDNPNYSHSYQNLNFQV